MIPIWLLPIMTTSLCGIGAWLAWRTGVVARRKAEYAREDRELEAWLEAMWRS